MKLVSFWLYSVRIQFRILRQYPLDFFLGAIATMATQATALVFAWAIFAKINRLGGYTFEEIMFLMGFVNMVRGLDMIFMDNLVALGWDLVRTGKFDVILLRPVPTLMQVISGHIQQDGFGLLALGATLVFTAISRMGIAMGPAEVCCFLFFLLNSALIAAAITALVASVAFYTPYAHLIIETVQSLQDLAQFPLTVFPGFIRQFLFFMVPYAFASFVPVNFLLGKDAYPHILFCPLVTGLAWFIAHIAWKRGLRHYGSTGG